MSGGGDIPSWRNNAGVNNGRVFRWTCSLVSMLPKRVSYALGWLVMSIAHRRMDAVTLALADNLRIVCPHASDRELDWLALATYQSYGKDVVDLIRSLSMSPAELDDLFVVRDRERFDAARALGRGLIVVTGHFGNWELGAVMMHHLGFPLDVVALAEPDPVVNGMRRQMRDSLGVRTIEVRQSLGTALHIRRRLGENATVAMLMDRHLGRDRVRVSFFGRDAWFLRAPALMGYLSGAPLVPCFIERQHDGRFLVLPGDPIHVDRTVDRDAAVRQVAQAFASALEERIHERPDLWYQFYPYWRSQDAASTDGTHAPEHAGRSPGDDQV